MFAGVEGAYRNAEMPKEQYETFCAEFRRIVETYPSLVPRMHKTLSKLGSIPEKYLIFTPLFE